jgi:hypothetical protein
VSAGVECDGELFVGPDPLLIAATIGQRTNRRFLGLDIFFASRAGVAPAREMVVAVAPGGRVFRLANFPELDLEGVVLWSRRAGTWDPWEWMEVQMLVAQPNYRPGLVLTEDQASRAQRAVRQLARGEPGGEPTPLCDVPKRLEADADGCVAGRFCISDADWPSRGPGRVEVREVRQCNGGLLQVTRQQTLSAAEKPRY